MYDPNAIDFIPKEDLPVHQSFEFDEAKMGRRPVNLTDEVIEMVAELLARRFTKGQVKGEIANILGIPVEDLGKTFIEITLRWARVWLRSNYMSRTLDDHMSQGIAYLELTIKESAVGSAVGLRAQKELNSMLGIGSQFQNKAYDPEETAEITRRLLGEMEDLVDDVASTDAADVSVSSAETTETVDKT